jgi:hypothetical protein
MIRKYVRLLVILLLALALLAIVSCKPDTKNPPAVEPSPAPTAAAGNQGSAGTITPDPQASGSQPTITPEPQASANQPTTAPAAPTQAPSVPTPIPVDYAAVKPNEIGEIPVVMFHNFVENLEETTDNEYTTSFDAFSQLLETLYAQNYRLISMRDFIDHNINVPVGKIPMVFTFDDGSAGQFNLIEQNGTLVVNPKSAVGIMMAFHEKHPDFGLKGIFYLNMDKELKTFEGAGTLKERLTTLLDLGFEVGNHSWGHFNFEKSTDRAQIQEKLGKNEKRLQEILPDVQFYSLALPFGGKVPQELADAMVQGEYEGVSYKNETIMAVGYLPSVPSIHQDYDPTYVRRIRSSGKIEVQFDLGYWLPRMTRDRMYISDGDPYTVTVPKGKEEKVNTEKLNGKNLVVY